MFEGLSLGAIILYCLPGIIALGRGHHNAIPIIVLDLLLGWTVLCWFIALIWSLTSVKDNGKEDTSTQVVNAVKKIGGKVRGGRNQLKEAKLSDKDRALFAEHKTDSEGTDVEDKIDRLFKLKQQGAITDDEYENRKKQLLS